MEDNKILKAEIESIKEEKRKERAKFTIDGWSDNELEWFEEQYKNDLEELVEMFPDKERAELLRAKKDRLNRDIQLHIEKYTDEEKELVLSNQDITYKELQKLLPKRSIWSLIYLKGILGIRKTNIKHTYRQLTSTEYDKLAEMKLKGIPNKEIIKELKITSSQLINILYSQTPSREISDFRKKYPDLVNNTKTLKHWTEEEEDLIIKLTKEGHTTEDLAQVFGVSNNKMFMKQINLGLDRAECNTRFKKERKHKHDAYKESIQNDLKELGFEDYKEFKLAYDKIKKFKRNSAIEQSENILNILKELCKKVGISYSEDLLEILERFSSIDFSKVEKYSLNFGKYKKKPLTKIISKDRDYCDWLMQASIQLVSALLCAGIYSDEKKKSHIEQDWEEFVEL